MSVPVAVTLGESEAVAQTPLHTARPPKLPTPTPLQRRKPLTWRLHVQGPRRVWGSRLRGLGGAACIGPHGHLGGGVYATRSILSYKPHGDRPCIRMDNGHTAGPPNQHPRTLRGASAALGMAVVELPRAAAACGAVNSAGLGGAACVASPDLLCVHLAYPAIGRPLATKPTNPERRKPSRHRHTGGASPRVVP
jgi:hypothetical protein